MNLPPGSLQLIMLLAPHLLKDKSDNDDDKFPTQSLDPAVFKMRNRNKKSIERK